MKRRVSLLALLLLFALTRPTRADGVAYHTVAWGETLSLIAARFHTDTDTLARLNNLSTNAWVYAGQTLKLPSGLPLTGDSRPVTPEGYYLVRAGDTLASIAQQFNVDPLELARVNAVPDNGYIYIGWRIKIPVAPRPAVPLATGVDTPTALTSQVHIVQVGESLVGIALDYDTTAQAIAMANNLPTNWLAQPGQRLVIPSWSPAPKPILAIPAAAALTVRLSGVPLYRQQQTLTCEEAAAAMALRGAVSESKIVAAMPRSDNPFLGIRGKTNSSRLGGIIDYGIYAQGLQRGLAKLGRRSTVLYGQSYADFKASVLQALRAGKPIIWWNTWRDSYQRPVSIKVSSGGMVKLVPYEHAVLVVGATDRNLTYHDPYDATVRTITWGTHQRVSFYFDNMALIIE